MLRAILVDPGMTLKLVICLTGTISMGEYLCNGQELLFLQTLHLQVFPPPVFLQSLTAHSPVCPRDSFQHYVHNLTFTFQTIPLQKIKPNSSEMLCLCF